MSPKNRDAEAANAPLLHAALQSPSIAKAGPQSAEPPTFSAIRSAIPAACFERSTWKGLAALAVTLCVYLGTTAWLYSAATWTMLILAAIARGLSIGPLFIVGHDACHDALTPHPWLNRFIGQLAFLPSLHTFTGWRYGHNFVHHQHTQILERDTGYPPLSPAQFAALPKTARAWYQLSRTPLGAGLLYLPLWWKYQAFPNAVARNQIRLAGPNFSWQQVLVALWLVFEACLFAGVFARIGWLPATYFSPWIMLLCGIFVTQLVWNTQMGFVTFLHHFHPKVAWHNEAEAPSAAQRQLESTVQIIFPAHTHWSMMNIFEHTAHHAMPTLPLYHLPRAQAALNRAFARHIPRERLTLRNISAAFATCKLWDTRAKQWVGYAAAKAK
jgi:acyl-lipid omega-6 desaturase (Delta-12 desaturase)